MKKEKSRNPYRIPISFRFSGFEPTQKSSFGLAKQELKGAYPLIKNVSFLGLRKGSKELHGWATFLTPTDCSKTLLQMQAKPINGIRAEKMGGKQAAEFAESLQPAPLKPVTKNSQKPRILQKMLTKMIIFVFNISCI